MIPNGYQLAVLIENPVVMPDSHKADFNLKTKFKIKLCFSKQKSIVLIKITLFFL